MINKLIAIALTAIIGFCCACDLDIRTSPPPVVYDVYSVYPYYYYDYYYVEVW